MNINSENTPNASDANYAGAAYTAGNTGLNSPGADLSGSPYSAAAGTGTSTGAAYASGSTDTSGKNANLQVLNDVYARASRWVKANPTLAISAAAGVLAAVAGIFASGRKRGNDSREKRYPNGQTYGKPYGAGSINYDPATQTESYNPTGSGSTTHG